jgi:hypothetical protein
MTGCSFSSPHPFAAVRRQFGDDGLVTQLADSVDESLRDSSRPSLA